VYDYRHFESPLIISKPGPAARQAYTSAVPDLFARSTERQASAVDLFEHLKLPTTPDAMKKYTQREKNLTQQARDAEETAKAQQMEIDRLKKEIKKLEGIEKDHSDRWDAIVAEKEAAQEDASEREQERDAALAQLAASQRTVSACDTTILTLNNRVSALETKVAAVKQDIERLIGTL
jgi:chromosome segregation ATPase